MMSLPRIAASWIAHAQSLRLSKPLVQPARRGSNWMVRWLSSRRTIPRNVCSRASKPCGNSSAREISLADARGLLRAASVAHATRSRMPRHLEALAGVSDLGAIDPQDREILGQV